MRMWKSYFPFAEITGLDINPECAKYQDDRIHIVVGDQADGALLKTLGAFDIIIDDGSHIPSDIKMSFETLYPSLNAGGWYVIVDIHAAYHARLDSIPDFFKTLLDCTAVRHLYEKYNIRELRAIDGLIAIKK